MTLQGTELTKSLRVKHAGLKQGAWFRESMRLLRAHPGAVSVLGEPITDGRLDLARPEANFCDERRVQFRVPVRGPKDKGHLLLWGSRPADTWQVDRLELELSSDPSRRLLVRAAEQPSPQTSPSAAPVSSSAAPASPSAVPTSPIVAPAL
ncbi:uncharacterized protein LOC119114232 isoform X2 [Pollicipes pollicipes]|uniref:uncharacterized protein LOC119114232 isoform X2 n=1 Tax=Pollicipes pollicipes TaxID=41117 RepID=UPI001884A76D|nr:uncharacterized protein LOC119114232 isoform X2 [Pollicipes pollicipes]